MFNFRRSKNSCRHSIETRIFYAASRSRMVPGPDEIRSGPFSARKRRKAPSVCILSVFRWAKKLHRYSSHFMFLMDLIFCKIILNSLHRTKICNAGRESGFFASAATFSHRIHSTAGADAHVAAVYPTTRKWNLVEIDDKRYVK